MAAEFLEMLITHPISIFWITLFATILDFEFLKKIPSKVKENASKWSLVFGVSNGLFVTLLYGFIKKAAPLWSMLIFPFILVCELVVISEDSKRSYFRIWLKCVFNFSCVYWGVTNILGILSTEYLTKEMVFSLTLLIVSVWTHYLSSGKNFSISNYKMIIHEKAAGKMFFRYFIICSIFLVFLTFNGKVFTIGPTMDEVARRMLCCEMFLKIAFIWWSSRLLFVMITNQMSYVKNEVYTENALDKERAFRNTVMRKGIFYLNIDITRDEIKEGAEFLNPAIWGNCVSFTKVIEGLLKDCIHPEDEEEFVHTNNREVIKERVDTAPYYSHQIRVSAKGISKYFSLVEQYDKHYLETDKEWIWLKIDYIYTKNSTTGDIFSYVAAFDVDLQVEQGEKLKKSASTDFLTGILNRAAIEKGINEKFEKKNDVGTFFIIDVDNFKSVNDELGHPMGDQLLKQIASTLTEVFRKNDMVGRLGGDEFCVFMKDVEDVEIIQTKAETLNAKCRIECQGEDGKIVKVSVSIGIATINPQISEYSELYKCADLALYETKRRGKDTYTIYSEGM